MGARGRKSSARLGVIQGIAERPEPPEELTAEQAEEWRAIVRRLPVAFFGREIHPLLAQYCRHVSFARHLAKMIETEHKFDVTDPVALVRYGRILGMQERESAALMGLATKLRISHQARYTPQAAATAAKGGFTGDKPWES